MIIIAFPRLGVRESRTKFRSGRMIITGDYQLLHKIPYKARSRAPEVVNSGSSPKSPSVLPVPISEMIARSRNFHLQVEVADGSGRKALTIGNNTNKASGLFHHGNAYKAYLQSKQLHPRL